VVQWAVEATASSTYANTSGISQTFDQLDAPLPYWSRQWDAVIAESGNDARLVEAHGWPFRSVWGEVVAPPGVVWNISASIVGRNQTPAPRAFSIPFRPVWGGLALNGAVYGAILLLIYYPGIRFRHYLKESNRLRRGCCMVCGYDLRFDLAKGCPECGWRRG
jgi:hypothetical protein